MDRQVRTPNGTFEVELYKIGVERLARDNRVVKIEIGSYAGDGWFNLYATPIVDFELMDYLSVPHIAGKIALWERESESMDITWQLDGDAQYFGGDGPAANASVLFRQMATTDHPRSSYGQMVLVSALDGKAFTWPRLEPANDR